MWLMSKLFWHLPWIKSSSRSRSKRRLNRKLLIKTSSLKIRRWFAVIFMSYISLLYFLIFLCLNNKRQRFSWLLTGVVGYFDWFSLDFALQTVSVSCTWGYTLQFRSQWTWLSSSCNMRNSRISSARSRTSWRNAPVHLHVKPPQSFPVDSIRNQDIFQHKFALYRVSNSPELGGESAGYIQAERMGRDHGDCTIYHAKCPRSLFSYGDSYWQ